MPIDKILKENSMAKNNSATWFRKIRGSYLPTSFTGLVIYLIYVAYVIAVAVEWFQKGYDYWTLLTVVLPVVAVAALIVQFIASKRSK
jgi:hypothetical protein